MIAALDSIIAIVMSSQDFDPNNCDYIDIPLVKSAHEMVTILTDACGGSGTKRERNTVVSHLITEYTIIGKFVKKDAMKNIHKTWQIQNPLSSDKWLYTNSKSVVYLRLSI